MSGRRLGSKGGRGAGEGAGATGARERNTNETGGGDGGLLGTGGQAVAGGNRTVDGRRQGEARGGKASLAAGAGMHRLSVKPQSSPQVPQSQDAGRPSASSQNDSHGHKSSMVVSILAGVDSDTEGASPGSGPKGLSKIFVVVLVGGIRYVTYACLLPSFSVTSTTSLIPV